MPCERTDVRRQKKFISALWDWSILTGVLGGRIHGPLYLFTDLVCGEWGVCASEPLLWGMSTVCMPNCISMCIPMYVSYIGFFRADSEMGIHVQVIY